MNKTVLNILVVTSIVLGFLAGCMTTGRFDLGGAQKAAYDEGFRYGLGKAKPGEKGMSYRVWGCKINKVNEYATSCLVTPADDPLAPTETIIIHAQDVREAMKTGSVFKLTRHGATFE
ncbi:MAG: hypothetical protein AAB561_01495 [Patescibacteria group bacterium]